MAKYIIVITTIAEIKDAKAMASALVKNELCTCINILPKCYSIYKWDNNIEENEEHILLIKTIADKYKEVERFIKSVHPYEIPEIISINIDNGLPHYLNWLNIKIK